VHKESSGSRCDETKPKGKHFNREHDDICAETETDREREREEERMRDKIVSHATVNRSLEIQRQKRLQRQQTAAALVVL